MFSKKSIYIQNNFLKVYTNLHPYCRWREFIYTLSTWLKFIYLVIPPSKSLCRSLGSRKQRKKKCPPNCIIFQSMQHWTHDLHQILVYTFNISWGTSSTSSEKFNFNLYLSTSFHMWFVQIQAIDYNGIKFLNASLELFHNSCFNRQEIVKK